MSDDVAAVLADVVRDWDDRYDDWTTILDALTAAGYAVVKADDLVHGDVLIRRQEPGREPTWGRVRKAFGRQP